jgi:antitoxin CcdA
MSLPPRDERRPVELQIRSRLIDAAREYGVDLDAAAEEGIRAAVSKRWLEENHEAIEANNRWFAENGLPLAHYRMF